MIDEKTLAVLIQDMRDFANGESDGFIWSGQVWRELADTIEYLSKIKQEAGK